ncbi:MAG: FGGY family carbohydrate kinase [Alphaproteobacteria bacterium]
MAPLACGIDIGSSNLKVALVSADGRVAALETAATPRIAVDGAVETDAAALVDTLERMVLAAWRRSGAAAPIAALATGGIGEDGVAVDAGLRPLGHAVPWFDLRAAAEAEELAAAFPNADAATGIGFEPTRTAAKWLWLARHRPDALPREATWIALTDFPLVRWSGRPFMAGSLAARTACFDLARQAWVPALLAAARAPRLPPVLRAGAAVGPVRPDCPLVGAGALRPDALLVAGGHDHPLAASLIRALASAAIADSVGTAELLYGESDRPLAHRPPIVRSAPIDGDAAEACLYVLPFAQLLAGFDPAAVRAALAVPPPVDAFAGPAESLADALPLAGPIARPSGDRPQAIWRTLEAAAYAVRLVLADMARMGLADGPLYATGGWVRPDPLAGMRAAALGRTVRRVREPELVALGAARLAMRALGPVSAPPEARLAVDVFAPSPSAAALHEVRYRSAAPALSAALHLMEDP